MQSGLLVTSIATLAQPAGVLLCSGSRAVLSAPAWTRSFTMRRSPFQAAECSAVCEQPLDEIVMTEVDRAHHHGIQLGNGGISGNDSRESLFVAHASEFLRFGRYSTFQHVLDQRSAAWTQAAHGLDR